METNDKRVINFRAFALGAAVMVGTIFFVFSMFQSMWYLLPLVLCLLGLGLYFGIKKSFGKLIYAFSVFAITLGILLLSVFTYNDNSVNDKYFSVSCRVESVYYVDVEKTTVIAEKVKLNGKRKYGKLLLSIYDAEEIKIGNELKFSGKVKSLDIMELAKGSYNLYKSNVKYKASIAYDKVHVTKGKLSLLESYKEQTKSKLLTFMGDRVGGVAYAMLFGDKALIDQDIYNQFKSSGTLHLIAVSGLNISIIIGIIYFLINKLRIKNLFKFLIMSIFLLIYCYLCEWTPSVVRSAIMGLVLTVSHMAGKKYDGLNSLGFAAMIILLIKPLSLYDVGFLLSFMAVLAIILFSKALDKVKFPNNIVRKVVTTMFLTMVITLFTYPITASFFRELALYSVFANLLVIPLFSLAYVLVFVLHLLSFIGLGVLLEVPKGVFNFIFMLTEFFEGLPWAVVRVTGLGLLVSLLMYLIAFVVSRFVMIKTQTKVISCFVIFVICATMVLGNNISLHNQRYITFATRYCDGIVRASGQNYLVGAKISRNTNFGLKQELLSQDITSIDGMIFASYDNFEVKHLENFLRYFNNCTIYVPQGHSAIAGLKSSGLKYIVYSSGVYLKGNIYISSEVLGGVEGISLATNGKRIVFAKNLTLLDAESMTYEIDYLYCKEDIANALVGKVIYDNKTISI